MNRKTSLLIMFTILTSTANAFASASSSNGVTTLQSGCSTVTIRVVGGQTFVKLETPGTRTIKVQVDTSGSMCGLQMGEALKRVPPGQLGGLLEQVQHAFKGLSEDEKAGAAGKELRDLASEINRQQPPVQQSFGEKSDGAESAG